MLKRLHYVSNGTMLAFSSLMLVVLLVACGSSSTSGTTSTPTSAPTSTPTLAPTSTSPSAASGAMTAFQGNSFTISYPQTWQVNQKDNNIFNFTVSTGGIKITINLTPEQYRTR